MAIRSKLKGEYLVNRHFSVVRIYQAVAKNIRRDEMQDISLTPIKYCTLWITFLRHHVHELQTVKYAWIFMA